MSSLLYSGVYTYVGDVDWHTLCARVISQVGAVGGPYIMSSLDNTCRCAFSSSWLASQSVCSSSYAVRLAFNSLTASPDCLSLS